MIVSRRHLLRVGVPALAIPAIRRNAWAQTYPARPLRIIVPLPAGGAADIVARLMGRWLERLGQPVIIENKPGAGTNIGVQAVINSAPDGYTLLLGGIANNAINPALFANLPYSAERDFVAVARRLGQRLQLFDDFRYRFVDAAL